MRLLAGAALLLVFCGCAGEESPPSGPNVVLISVESLRTDHVGALGGSSPTRPDVPVTPAIDAFAEGATVYADAQSVTSWTLASHASLFTGLYPTAHQTDGPRDLLDDSYPTLAEALRERGYQTAGIVSGPYLRRTHNLHQGFELWDDSIASITSHLAHDDVTNPRMEEALRAFIETRRDPERPFLLFAYFWDPHYDFLPPPPYDTMFLAPGAEAFDARDFDRNPAIHAGMEPARLSWLLAQYAGELRWTDAHLGRFFALLREKGLWDDTMIVLTADHGEEFFDHGEKGHKNNLYAETVRVPLIVKYPGQREGRRDDRLVSLVDLVPTVLEVTGTPASFPVQGRSLLSAAPEPGRPVLYELLSVWYYRGDERAPEERRTRWHAVREGGYKRVWREGPDGAPALGPQLFDVEADPTERRDLEGDEPALDAELARRHDELLSQAREIARRYRRGGRAELRPEEVEQLRALGYLEP